MAAILSAIRAVTLPTAKGGKGCLLIVKNYTGDRLNFGMACELASAEGYGVSMVVVADDCALPRAKGITGARGVAGTVLVHKAAGGKAGLGASLADVTAAAEAVSGAVSTMGVALSAVTVPGAEEANDRLDGPEMEVGMGIHGEAGARMCPLKSCDGIAGEMLDAIQSFGRIGTDGESVVPLYAKGDELLVLVNNLGGTSNFEMSLLARSVVSRLEDVDGCVVSRVLVGSFMTSFDMQGASVSVLPLKGDVTDEIVALVDKETTAPAWVGCDILVGGKARPSATEIEEVAAAAAPGTESSSVQLPPVEVENFADLARDALAACSAALAEAEPLLTKYDTIVGDGDCGLTMKRGADEIASRLAAGSLRLDHPSTMFADLADAVSSSMGGTSGILLELMFRKIGVALSSSSGGGIAAADLAEAFKAGVEAVSFYGGAQEGSRTMVS